MQTSKSLLSKIYYIYMGTGLNCTKIKLHEVIKLHEGTKLHEDDFAPRVNFSRVTFLLEIKNIQKKKKQKKKTKSNLIKKNVTVRR